MNRVSRSVVAAAMAAAVALGAAAPAAAAGPPAEAKVTKAAKAAKAAKAKAPKEAKGKFAEVRNLSQAQRKLYKEAVRKEAYLTRLQESDKVTRLGVTVAGQVQMTIAGDLDAVRDLKDAAVAGTVTPEDTATLRALRPEVYNTILNQLRLVLELKADPAADATVLGELMTKLLGFNASTPRAELKLVQAQIEAVKAALEEAEDADEPAPTEIETPADPVS